MNSTNTVWINNLAHHCCPHIKDEGLSGVGRSLPEPADAKNFRGIIKYEVADLHVPRGVESGVLRPTPCRCHERAPEAKHDSEEIRNRSSGAHAEL